MPDHPPGYLFVLRCETKTMSRVITTIRHGHRAVDPNKASKAAQQAGSRTVPNLGLTLQNSGVIDSSQSDESSFDDENRGLIDSSDSDESSTDNDEIGTPNPRKRKASNQLSGTHNRAKALYQQNDASRQRVRLGSEADTHSGDTQLNTTPGISFDSDDES